MKTPDPLYWQKLRQKSLKEHPLKRTPLKRSGTKIKKRSDKRAKQEREYSVKRKKYLEANSECQARLPMCTHVSTTIHHPGGRIGDLLTDESNFIGLCLPCHEWVESHPKEAKEMNLSKSRLNKQ